MNCICPTVTVYFAVVPPPEGAVAATFVKVWPIIAVLEVVEDVGVVVISPTVTSKSAPVPDPPVPATFAKVWPIIEALLVVEDVGVIVIGPIDTLNVAFVPPAAGAEPAILMKDLFIRAALPVVVELEIVTALKSPIVTSNVPASVGSGGLGSIMPVCVTP